MPMHTIREITRLAIMLAGLIAPRIPLGLVLASISCEHCRSSRNNPHSAPRHVIYYYVPQARKLVFPSQLRVTEYCVFRYRGIQCKNWTAHAHTVLQRNTICFLFFFFSLLHRTALAPYWQSLVHLNCACIIKDR